ncbi:MAG: hypothetical protein Q9M36_07340 [Sulfurovum sp.]|nr:hypothetical protein [Sulfurovum sp.]
MKNIIAYNIIIVFLISGFTLGIVFFYSIKDDGTENETSYIKSELIKETLKSTATLFGYNKRILSSSDYYIDPQAYLKIVREVSLFIKGTNLEYIKSYIKVGERFILTATSSTDAQFRAKSYSDYAEENIEDTRILSNIYDNHTTEEIFEGDILALQVTIKKYQYFIISKINRDKIHKVFENNYETFFIILVLMILVLIILLVILSFIHKEIVAIDKTLEDFFDYMLRDKNIEEVHYIQKISKNQLGILSKNINYNLKEIISHIHDKRVNTSLNNTLILELVQVLSPKLDDLRVQNIQGHTNHQDLHTLKTAVNALLINTDTTLTQMNDTIQEYLHKKYIPSLDSTHHQAKVLELFQNINQLGQNHSSHLVETIEHLITISTHGKYVDSHIENTTSTLHIILRSIKKIVHTLKADYKFAFEFDNSIKVIKQENVYVNNLLDNFGNKYEESITLIDDLKSGLFTNNTQLFISRIDEVIKDSSIRDNKAQKILIEQVRELTNKGVIEVSTQKVRGLLRLLLEELVKDIRYSLYLIETKVEKLSSASANKVSSLGHIENLSKDIRDMLLQDLKDIPRIQESASEQLNNTDDLMYEILEHHTFIGQEPLNKILLHKGEF